MGASKYDCAGPVMTIEEKIDQIFQILKEINAKLDKKDEVTTRMGTIKIK